MRIPLSELRLLVGEALKRADAERVAAALETSAAKVNARVKAEADTSGGLINVFARFVSGDVDVVERVLADEASKQGWTLLSRAERRGIVWWFEPNPETKGALSSTKLPKELYHVTPRVNVASIMETGLEPRRRQTPGGTTRRYAPRVYLATDPAGALATINHEADWVMLKVDRSRLPKGRKFYVDQEFGHRKDGLPIAVFTLDPIPPSAISPA